MEVAGHRLGPGVGDADRRPAERVVVEADALHVGARGGAVGAVEDDAGAGTRERGRGAAVGAHERNLLARSKTSTGPGPAPISRRPAPTAAEAISRAARAASSGVLAEGEMGRQRRGVGAAGAVGGAVRVALAFDRDRLAPVEEEVDHSLAVAAGDDDRLAAPAPAPRAPAPPGSRPPPAPVSARASGMFGVTTVASGSSRSTSASRASSSSRTAPLSATITGSTTTGASPTSASASTTASTVSAVPSIPILTASTPMSSATARDLGDDHRRRDRLDRARPRPCSAR